MKFIIIIIIIIIYPHHLLVKVHCITFSFNPPHSYNMNIIYSWFKSISNELSVKNGRYEIKHRFNHNKYLIAYEKLPKLLPYSITVETF